MAVRVEMVVAAMVSDEGCIKRLDVGWTLRAANGVQDGLGDGNFAGCCMKSLAVTIISDDQLSDAWVIPPTADSAA